ncbi:MAG: ATP-dependent DNA helicase Rep [Lentisphaerae bacterium]|nr:ATP-dependent DNA helicase Rep [Lentisphaerota bacterium]
MQSAEAILSGLNPEQRRAASTIEGPVLVLAGAGTGKTRVITYRIAYMLATGIAPEHILGMTFTNKAATEMKERLADLCGKEAASKVTLGTFHAFAGRLLRKEIGVFGYLPNFTIADDSDQKSLIKQAAAACGIARDDANIPQAANYISRCKNAMLSPEEAMQSAAPGDEIYAQIYSKYQNQLLLQNMLDFDDLLFFTHRLLRDHLDVRERCQERYRYLLVDEYQDTNLVQFEMVKLLAGERQNLCVVGDDDQSIYGWRGADAENILKFTDYFPRARQQEIKLEQNYRSTNNILKAANAAIAGGYARKEKNLWSAFGDGELIKIAACESAESEAGFIADYIAQFFDEHRGEYKYSDCAILYRSNYLSRQLEQTLRSRGIPYQLVGGQEFFQRSEVKDAVSYLKLIANPREDQSLLRILGNPPRGLGNKAVEKLKELRQNGAKSMLEALGCDEFLASCTAKARTAAMALRETIKKYRGLFTVPGELAAKTKAYLYETGFLDGLQKVYKDIEDATKRRENVDEFINSIAQYEAKQSEDSTLQDFLEKFALLEENDRTADESDQGDGVILTTIHASKGLEFPLVFLVAMERKIFPNERAMEEDSLDEELRLFYVALTRAKRHLVLTHARERFRYGKVERSVPSDFLYRLPEDLTDAGDDYEFIKQMSVNDINAEFAKIFELLK